MAEEVLVAELKAAPAEKPKVKESAEKVEKASGEKNTEANTARAAKQKEAEKAWRDHYAKLGESMDDLGYAERVVIRQAIEAGMVPHPHESAVRIDSSTLSANVPPEVRKVIARANDLLDLLPAKAYAQQIEIVQQSIKTLNRLGVSKEVQDEVEDLLRDAVVEAYAAKMDTGEQEQKKPLRTKTEAKDKIRPPEEEVRKNAELNEKARLVKAEEVLREKELLAAGTVLSPTQQEGILLAHYEGQGEEGKVKDTTAEVFNYTFKQLFRKERILFQHGFTEVQARALIQAGIAAETITPPVTPIPAELQNIIDEVNMRATKLNELDSNSKHDPRWLQNQIELINDLYVKGVIPNTYAREVVQVRNQIEEILRPLTGERLGWQLMESDREMLRGGEFKVGEWVEMQFNQAYILAEKGQEASSPQIQYLQSRLNEANTVITAYYNQPGNRRSDLGTYLSKTIFDTFNTRLNVLYMKTMIERRDDKQIIGQAITTGAEGVAKAMNLDDGKVLMFFNEMCGLLEDMRLRQGGLEYNITPKMLEKMLNQVKEDQYKLAQLGMGSYALDYGRVRDAVDGYVAERAAKGTITTTEQKENEIHELTKAQMIRSERPAFDLLVVLQQLSLINARGDFQINDDLRQTVPGGGLPFNMLTYKVGPGQKLSAEGEAILNEWLINLADRHIINKTEDVRKEEKKHHMPKRQLEKPDKFHRLYRLDLGKKLFGKAYEPADFFSSGWRMNTLKTQLGEYFIYKYALQSILVKKEILDENGRVIGIEPPETRPATDQDVKDRKVTPKQVEDARKRIRSDTDGELKIAQDRAEEFALFVRLKTAYGTEPEKKANAKKVWEKIATLRPEEIMRLFRDKAAGEAVFINFFNSKPFLSNIPMDDFSPNPKLQDGDKMLVSREQQEAMYRYDKFKDRYGLIIRTIRNKAYQEEIPRQVNFAKLETEEKDLINKFFENNDTEAVRLETARLNALYHNTEAERLMGMYQAMQNMIVPPPTLDAHGNEVPVDLGIRSWLDPDPNKTHKTMIDALLDDARFEGIYDHTLNVDDTLMGKLETVEYDFSDMVAISKVWSNERGADALTRNFQDIADANAAQQAILKFLDESDFKERMKGLKEAAMAVYDMNGPDTRVEMYMAGLTTILLLAKKYEILDIFNFTKLWFQIPSSKLEKLIGPHSTPLGSGELLAIINEFQNPLIKHLGEERPEDKFLSPEVRENKIKKRVHDAEEAVREIKKLVGVDVRNMIKRKSIGLVAFLIMALFAESLSAGFKGITEKAA